VGGTGSWSITGGKLEDSEACEEVVGQVLGAGEVTSLAGDWVGPGRAGVGAGRVDKVMGDGIGEEECPLGKGNRAE
jgi:hypothetical protein